MHTNCNVGVGQGVSGSVHESACGMSAIFPFALRCACCYSLEVLPISLVVLAIRLAFSFHCDTRTLAATYLKYRQYRLCLPFIGHFFFFIVTHTHTFFRSLKLRQTITYQNDSLASILPQACLFVLPLRLLDSAIHCSASLSLRSPCPFKQSLFHLFRCQRFSAFVASQAVESWLVNAMLCYMQKISCANSQVAELCWRQIMALYSTKLL